MATTAVLTGRSTGERYQGQPGAALAAAAAYRDRDLRALREWLAIPSVSADPRCAPAVTRAADWLAGRLREAGARVCRIPTGGGPDVVVGEVAADRPGRPVVLVYGHYDVRPAGRGWTSPAFTPTRRGGLLYARGSNDDKGQLFAHVAALHAWCRTGRPPVGVTVVAEGAEEIGSPGFEVAMTRLRARLRPDVVLVSDTERADGRTPAVVLSQRGQLSLEIRVHAGGPAVHAGRLGGVVVDPCAVLVAVLASVRRGLSAWAPPANFPAALPVVRRTDAELVRAARGRAVVGTRLDHRLTHRAAVSITDLRAGDSSGAAPAACWARLDIRVPPGREPRHVLTEVRRVVGATAPPRVRVDVRALSAHRGSVLSPPTWVRSALAAASRVGFGRPPVYVRSGGSIPAVAMLQTVFGRDPVLLGLGSPAGNAHGPQEHLDLPGWNRAVRMSVALLATLGDAAADGRRR